MYLQWHPPRSNGTQIEARTEVWQTEKGRHPSHVKSEGTFICKYHYGGLKMSEKKVGEVMKFFSKPSVAAVKITEGDVSVGDSLKFSGHTTDFTDVIQSMEVDNKSVQKAVAGDFIGIKVSDRVRPGDEVFKVSPD